MNNYIRNLTGKNLKKQKSRIFKIEDELWDKFVELANELSNEGGLKISSSELLRRIILKTLKETGKW